MGFAIASAILSAIFLALMIVTDRVMVGACYRNSAEQAWFVSSVAGGLFGLIFTGMAWLIAIGTGEAATLSDLLALAVERFFWRGLAMCALGALAVQTLLHYFRLQTAQMHSAVIATWLAALPLFVYAGMLIITLLVPISGVVTTTLNPLWIVGVVTATAGLVAFERASSPTLAVGREYRTELAKLISTSVLFFILFRQLSGENESTSYANDDLALMPYYWFGFFAGVRVISDKSKRHELKSNLGRRMKFFLVPILITEIIGMLELGFEYFALSELDPALVSLLVGAHVLLVYAMNYALGRWRDSMQMSGIRRWNRMGIRVSASRLPLASSGRKQVCVELTSMAVAIAGIALALYATPTAFR